MSPKSKEIDHDFMARMREIVDKMGGQNALSRASHVSLGSIQKALSGSEPTRMNLIRLAQASGVTLSWLAEGQEGQSSYSGEQASEAIPVRGLAESGKKGWFKVVPWEIHCDLQPRDPNSFAIIVSNNSLAPEGVKSGFVCIASPATIAAAGDIVFIEKHDGNSALRLLEETTNEKITLAYYNEDQTKQTERLPRNEVRQISTVLYVKRRL